MIAGNNATTVAYNWAKKECVAVGIPSPWEIYRTKGSIGERYKSRWDELLKKYKLKDWWYKTRIGE